MQTTFLGILVFWSSSHKSRAQQTNPHHSYSSFRHLRFLHIKWHCKVTKGSPNGSPTSHVETKSKRKSEATSDKANCIDGGTQTKRVPCQIKACLCRALWFTRAKSGDRNAGKIRNVLSNKWATDSSAIGSDETSAWWASKRAWCHSRFSLPVAQEHKTSLNHRSLSKTFQIIIPNDPRKIFKSKTRPKTKAFFVTNSPVSVHRWPAPTAGEGGLAESSGQLSFLSPVV